MNDTATKHMNDMKLRISKFHATLMVYNMKKWLIGRKRYSLFINGFEWQMEW